MALPFPARSQQHLEDSEEGLKEAAKGGWVREGLPAAKPHDPRRPKSVCHDIGIRDRGPMCTVSSNELDANCSWLSPGNNP